MRPFMSYFGSKWRLAPEYPKPKYGHIVEPFAGGAGYATRYFDLDVSLFETNDKIAGIWRFLIRAKRDDILSLPVGVYSLDDLPKSIPEEGRNLIGMWFAGGIWEPRRNMSPWGRRRENPGNYWSQNLRERLADQVEKISHWKIYNKSFEDAPNFEATWFIDPPYISKGVSYTHGSKGIDYSALGAWCKSRIGQVIVCEAEGAKWLPFTHFRTMKSVTNKQSSEVVWLNVR